MAEKIAEYFGQLKFVVDDKGLKEFVKQLEMAAKSMKAVTMASGTHGMRAIAEGMKKIGTEAKQAASQVEQAVGKMDRASSKSARTQKTLVGLKATDIKSRGALGDFQNRAQLIAMRDYAARMNSARDARDNLRAQRRAETASREDERRFQNRVSRTYAPKASRMALYQADLVRTQAAYNAAMAAGGAGAARYAEAIKKLKREIIGLKYEQSRLRGGFGLRSGAINSALTPMLGMAAAGGAAGLGYGAVAITDQLVKQQNISAQFQGLYGSEAAGQAGYGRFKEYANMRGVRQAQIAQDYLGFMYSAKTNIGLEGANKIFENFTDLARVRGTSGERYQRALAALSQMTSKNRIYSEELTQQLSEHLFGSKEIFAEVITGKKGGDAMTELLKRMKSDAGVVTAEWLPKVSEEMARLAKESGVLDKMSNNLDASLARLNNRWWDFIAAMDELGTGEKIGSVIDQIADGLKDLTQWMRENQDTVEMLTESLRTFFSILLSRYTVIFMAVAGFVALASGVAKAAAAIRLLGVAGAIASAPMLVLIGLIGLVALAIEDVYSWAKGDESILSYWIGDSSEYFIPLFDFIDDMKKRWSDAIDFVTGKWNAFKDLVNQPIEYAEKLWGNMTNIFGNNKQPSPLNINPADNVRTTLPVSPSMSFGQVNVYANDANSFYRDLNAYYPKVPK